MSEIFLTDTHCHLNYIPIEEVEETIARADKNGVKRMITIGTDYGKSVEAVNIANRYDNIYATVGVHPSDADGYKSTMHDDFIKLASSEKVVAIGEIGLDFFRDHSPREVQERVFIEFLNISIDLSKPIVIHNRESSDRMVDILSSELAVKNNGGIIHCYNGDKKVLDWAIRNGFHISLAGNVTYKNAGEIRDMLKFIPLDKILIETDSPFLTPSAMRGKVKNNEPAFVKYTFSFIADFLKIAENELADMLEKNVKSVFNI